MRCYLLAAEEGLEEATESARPTRKSCAAGSSHWGRVGHLDGVRRAKLSSGPLPYPTLPQPPLFLGSSSPRLIVKLSGCLDVPTLIHRCKTLSVSSALVASRPSNGPSHGYAVLRAPRNTWSFPRERASRASPRTMGLEVASTPRLWFPVSDRRTRDPAAARRLQPGAGGASFWARCAA